MASAGQNLAPTGNTEHTRPENRLFFPALDGLRAIALLMVFGQHYWDMPWGYTGVDLFFVLSGFLITGILFDTRNRPDRVRSFFVRRTLRIFPLYYGVLLLLFALTPVGHFHWNRYWLVWPAYLGNIIRFVHPYSTDFAYQTAANGQMHIGNSPYKVLFLGHFWSLCLEEQFYLAWPWVVFWIKDRLRLTWLCAFIVLAMPLVRTVVMAWLPLQYTTLELPYSFTPLRVDALLFGGLLALLIRSEYRDLTLKICRWMLAVAAPLVFIYLLRTVHRHQHYAYHPWRLTWGQSVIDLLFTAVIASALVPRGIVYQIGKLAPLRWLGRISYGLYVFHDIPHYYYGALTSRLGNHVPLIAHHMQYSTAAVGCSFTVVIAWLSFKYFESPFLDLKERLAPSHSTPARPPQPLQPPTPLVHSPQ